MDVLEEMIIENGSLPIHLIVDHEGSAAPDGGAAPSRADSSFVPWLDADTGSEFGYCVQDEDGYRICLYGVGSFTFGPRSDVVRGVPDPDVGPEACYRAFCRQVLPRILPGHSWEVLHANGLVISDACVALCGGSRMGKSTLAYAWRRQGGCVYADDAVPFRIEGAAVALCPIPFRIRPRSPARDYFDFKGEGSDGSANRTQSANAMGDPRRPAASPFRDRGLAPRRRSSRESAVPALTPLLSPCLQAIYLLDRRQDEEDGPVRIDPVGPQTALPVLLKQAFYLHLRDRSRNREMVEHFIALASAVPTFRLSYPTGLHHVEVILGRLSRHVAVQVSKETMRGAEG